MSLKSTLSYVHLNIEGTKIKTLESTCKSIPDSLLASLNEKSEKFDVSDGTFYFDREVKLFFHILAAHRDGELHIPRDVCPIRFRREMEFWKVPHKLIAQCCWKYFYKCDDEITVLNEVIQSIAKNTALGSVGIATVKTQTDSCNHEAKTDEKMDSGNDVKKKWQQRIWTLLDQPHSSRAAKIWCFMYMFVVIISVFLNIIWLDTAVRVEPYLSSFISRFSHQELIQMALSNRTSGSNKARTLLVTDPHKALFALDCFCTGFFLIETIVHFIACPGKSLYIYSPYNALKLVLSVCMILGLIFEIRKDWLLSRTIVTVWFAIKSLNTLRIVLILRLHKLYTSLNLVYLSMKSSIKEMTLLLVLFLFTVVIYGGLIFSLEMQSDMFSDTRKAMWWALITMTTVGYGDFYPTQTAGYIIGTLCAINGLIVIALPIAAISSNFANIYSRNSNYQRHLQAVEREENKKVLAK